MSRGTVWGNILSSGQILLYRLNELTHAPIVLQRPTYVVERIAPHPLESTTIALIVRGPSVRQVHVLRLDQLDDFKNPALLNQAFPEQPSTASLSAGERVVGRWEILEDEDRDSVKTSARYLTLLFSADGKHVILAKEGTSAGKDIVIKRWALRTGGPPRRDHLSDQVGPNSRRF